MVEGSRLKLGMPVQEGTASSGRRLQGTRAHEGLCVLLQLRPLAGLVGTSWYLETISPANARPKVIGRRSLWEPLLGPTMGPQGKAPFMLYKWSRMDMGHPGRARPGGHVQRGCQAVPGTASPCNSPWLVPSSSLPVDPSGWPWPHLSGTDCAATLAAKASRLHCRTSARHDAVQNDDLRHAARSR
eukprot:205979-Chlamydomonas_euryale.AAC.2